MLLSADCLLKDKKWVIGPIPRAYSVGEETGKELQDSRAQVVVEVWGENPGWREERTLTGGSTQLSLPGCGGACPHAGGDGGEAKQEQGAKVLAFEELKVVRCDQQRGGTSLWVLTGERAASS